MSVTVSHARDALRRYAPSDAAHVARWVRTPQELHQLAPAASWPLTPRIVHEWIRSDGHVFVLPVSPDDGPAAYGELNPMRDRSDHWWIGHLIVAPEQRGKGFGSRMVRLLLREAFDGIGANRVSLIVFPENKAAIRCYRSVGFREIGFEMHDFGDSRSQERLMRLEINKRAGFFREKEHISR